MAGSGGGGGVGGGGLVRCFYDNNDASSPRDPLSRGGGRLFVERPHPRKSGCVPQTGTKNEREKERGVQRKKLDAKK